MEAIARHAGLTQGAIYSNFTGKADLWWAIGDQMSRTLDLSDSLRCRSIHCARSWPMSVGPCGSSSVRRRGPSCCCPRSSTCTSCAIPGSVRSTPARLAAISASWPPCWSGRSGSWRVVAHGCTAPRRHHRIHRLRTAAHVHARPPRRRRGAAASARSRRSPGERLGDCRLAARSSAVSGSAELGAQQAARRCHRCTLHDIFGGESTSQQGAGDQGQPPRTFQPGDAVADVDAFDHEVVAPRRPHDRPRSP